MQHPGGDPGSPGGHPDWTTEALRGLTTAGAALGPCFQPPCRHTAGVAPGLRPGRHANTFGMAHSAELDAAPRAEGGTAGWPSLKQCPLSSPMLYTARGACEGGTAGWPSSKQCPVLAPLNAAPPVGHPALHLR